jgi:hypothetical protein
VAITFFMSLALCAETLKSMLPSEIGISVSPLKYPVEAHFAALAQALLRAVVSVRPQVHPAIGSR